MQFKPCQPYHAVLAGKTLRQMSDGKSAFSSFDDGKIISNTKLARHFA